MYTRFLSSRGVVLRKMAGRLDAAFQYAGGAVPVGSAPALSVPTFGTGVLFALLALTLLIVALVFGMADVGALALANGAAVATPKSLREILTELKKLQDEYTGKPMPPNEAERFEALAGEAKALQDAADREKQIKQFESFSREVPDPALPGGAAAAEAKNATTVEQEIGGQVAGYVSVGDLVASNAAVQALIKAGAPAGQMVTVDIKGLQGRYVPLTRDQRKAVTESIGALRREHKAIPTIGTGVIEPERINDVVRVTEQDELRLRDLLNVSQTGATSVQWVRINSYTRAAAPVAETAAKPEAGLTVGVVNTPVVTLAVHMPVTEQQLQDAPQVTNMINTELLWDLDKVEEEEIMYGDGTGQHFLGITNDPGVLAGRTVGGDTNLDKIRRAMTDIRRAGYAPNGVAIDPLDWEGIVLLKGTDNRYIWVVVTGAEGDRVWGLRVVETIGAEENAGNTTEERNIVVGDWIRGATLWDRMQAQVQVGWINQQFIENMRTIRAERRAAFAVRRPKAFRKITTVAAVE